ncbi:peptidoglycan-binding domain-containing protein [Streptomyces sp. DSM 40750]|uniref:peptidoglycan-binding domain-containing protein n=1 Tax=Streptomyces sp. DSM 40750 TaxID=2801030 RepID=UPI00214BCF2B|nr:peptidoglycan-binding protein LysM [Streptomyces sp. DSM 40750]UUU24948.1 peptidoglycan-binding protein LysM [Streptomyces sp. DSM 40750]
MTSFHAAVVHADQSVTYCGTVDTHHLRAVRAMAALPFTPHRVVEHPRRPGSVFVLREDGDLDWYEPVDTERPRVRPRAPAPPAHGSGQEAEVAGAVAGAVPLTAGDQGTMWIGAAIRFGDGVIGGPMDTPRNPPRVVHHTTESPAGGKYLESVASYLIEVAAEPHLIYCPVTDRVGQFGPLHHSGRALRNDGSRRTNREGRVCVQIEVLGRASRPWTDGWDPREHPGWQRILAAIRSWGVPDDWPMGPPVPYPGGSPARTRSVWQSEGGHFGHCHVPGNDHGDPGAIDTAKVLSLGTGTGSPGGARPKVSLGRVVAAARKDPPAPDGHRTYPRDVRLVEEALAAEGLLECGYVDGSFGTRTLAAYAAWQRSRAGGSYRGGDADGVPGRDSLTRLGDRHGFTVTG